MNKNKFTITNELLAGSIGDAIQVWILQLGPRLLPLTFGFIFGLGVAEFLGQTLSSMETMSQLPGWFLTASAIAMASLIALGLESVGFNSFRSLIIDLSVDRDGDWTLAISGLSVTGYVLITTGSLWLTDVSQTHQIITSAMALVTAINYMLMAKRQYKVILAEQAAQQEIDKIILEEKKKTIRQRARMKRKEEREGSESFQKVSEGDGKVSGNSNETDWNVSYPSASESVKLTAAKIGKDRLVETFIGAGKKEDTARKTAANWISYLERDGYINSGGNGVQK